MDSRNPVGHDRAVDIPAPVDPTSAGAAAAPQSAAAAASHTAWARNLQTPLRMFLRDQTSSAVAMVAAAIAALIWANIGGSYASVWGTTGALTVGPFHIAESLRGWVNSGLMTFFFFTVGLEARREFDLGDLRDRRRLLMPLGAGIGGMVASVAVFVLIAHRYAAHGAWGTAMSTDTAFALAMLGLVGKRFPLSLRAFILTVQVVDDVVGLLVIAVVFTHHLQVLPLIIGLAAMLAAASASMYGLRRDGIYLLLGVIAWIGFQKAGIDPVVVGLLIGLMTSASTATREELEQASDIFRLFREQPTSELNRDARAALSAAVSPNERLQTQLHETASYVIVPLFALANAGTVLSGHVLTAAYGSAITLGIIGAYVVGKPIGIVIGSSAVVKASRGRLRLPVGLASVVGGGASAGVGFTVSLLIATLAFHDKQLSDAKIGILSTIVLAPVVTWLCEQGTRLLPAGIRKRAIIGSAPVIVDLAVPVDPERDHVRGPEDAPVTIVEYGDLECPYCGRAEQAIRPLLSEFGGRELRYVWRHLPLNDVHPRAQFAAEASEAAGAQGKFWEMHDLMLSHQDQLTLTDVKRYAEQLDLDMDRFTEFMHRHKGKPRIAEDVESADLSSVTGTPTFFVNGHRYQGAYDLPTLQKVVRTAAYRG
jgi:Na+/H+ antiporter NhaA